MDLWSIVKKVDTTKMSAEALKTFIQETLVPAIEKEWGERGYEIYENSDGGIVYCPYCEECGALADSESVTVYMSTEVYENEDLEDIFSTEDVDYIGNMNAYDWCSCDEEDDYEDEE